MTKDKFKEKPRLLIVDGSALLFQSFYGMPRKIQNKNGDYVEAVVCFFGILFKTLKMLNPQQLLVVFDGETQLERQSIDVNYKANRQDFSDALDANNPFEQLETIKEVLNFLDYKFFETTCCEADDIIASVVNDFQHKFEIIILSHDKDFFQLINENVSVFTYRGKLSQMWTKHAVEEKYSLNPKYFSTLKSLVGDNSDNIKGLKGIGIKTATKLIQEYGTLTNIYQNIDKIPIKTADILNNNKNVAERNFQIINLQEKTNLFFLPDCHFATQNTSSVEVLRRLNIL